MYYDASSTDYISTPSFAIPDTGILTIEAWMKSAVNAGYQTIIGDGGSQVGTIAYIYTSRYPNGNLVHQYAYGASVAGAPFSGFFTGLDNQ
ncbi:MAG: hypothetical protein WC422_05400 [Candidatus Paceibacterota bacterium]|jgi:hypothetical protein